MNFFVLIFFWNWKDEPLTGTRKSINQFSWHQILSWWFHFIGLHKKKILLCFVFNLYNEIDLFANTTYILDLYTLDKLFFSQRYRLNCCYLFNHTRLSKLYDVNAPSTLTFLKVRQSMVEFALHNLDKRIWWEVPAIKTVVLIKELFICCV